ncbi:hypothetical protein ABZV31_09670 [Streptomyces sp. NPDC005202]|uniref:hypothetical protein n=1 Tax=Streptomyces sp. NPDC005202 TaxID=3157021 RepID=UPI0033BF410B
MKSTTVRRVTLSIAAATALTGVAACSSSGSGEGDGAAGQGATRVSPISALRSAEQSTDRADSAKVVSTTTIGTLMSMEAHGTLAWGHGLTGTLTLTYTGGSLADTMRRLDSSSMQARYLPDAYYARMGDRFARQADGKHWLRYGYDDLATLAGGSGAYLKEQMQNTTPNQSVKLLLASGDVKKVGEATVAGQHTTHYAGTVNVDDLAAENSHLTRNQLDQLRKQLTQAGVSTETVDIWVNDQNLLVKQVSQAQMAMGRMTQTAYYTHYGVKVSAQQPPASDTEDFKDLLKKRGGTFGGTGTTS